MTVKRNGAIEGRLLAALDIGEPEEQVYRWLLAHPGTNTAEISEGLTFGLRKTQQLLNVLETMGFATHSPEHPRRYIPASPDIAVAALVRNRREELDRVLSAVPELRKQAARGSENREQVVELITSREAERQIYQQMPVAAEKEIVALVRPPMLISRLDVPPEQDPDHRTQRESRARGVRYRSIVDAAFLELPEALHSTHEDMKAGEEVRVLSQLPFKMVLADRRIALIPLNLQQPDSPSLLVRSSALLDAIYALFEILWERAAPLSFEASDALKSNGESPALSGEMEDLVALLAAGLNDKAIVQELGVSRRTLLRRVAGLMKYLDSRTRFQTGWLAALRLSGPQGDRDRHP